MDVPSLRYLGKTDFPGKKSMNYVYGRSCCERENNQLALETDSLVSLVEPWWHLLHSAQRSTKTMSRILDFLLSESSESPARVRQESGESPTRVQRECETSPTLESGPCMLKLYQQKMMSGIFGCQELKTYPIRDTLMLISAECSGICFETCKYGRMKNLLCFWSLAGAVLSTKLNSTSVPMCHYSSQFL